MAFDASGTFTRTAGIGDTGATVWQDDAAAGTRILASRHDTHDQDLASGLSQCLTRHGWGVPSVDIPWGGKRIVNMGEPIAQQDAATKHYVDNPDAATTARAINGADLDGRLNFTALSGTNGITWTYADLSWVARHSVPGEANDRLVLGATVAPDTTGPAAGLADVFVIDDAGRINSAAGRLTQNVSYEGTAPRAISPGIGTVIGFGNGAFTVSSNDTATITNNYAAITPRAFFSVENLTGITVLTLDKSGTDKLSRIQGTNGGEYRWIMDIGDSQPESSTRTGSNFSLFSFDNDGAGQVLEMQIDRATHKVTFAGEVTLGGATGTMGSSTAASSYVMNRPIDNGSFHIYGGTTSALGAYLSLYGETHAANGGDIILGTNDTYRYFFDFSANRHYWRSNTGAAMDLDASGNLSIAGQMNVDSIIQSTDAAMIMASAVNGAIIFRCNGAASTAEQVNIDATGSFILQSKLAAATGGIWAGKGVLGKIGQAGAYGAYFQNFNWNGSVLTAYANASVIGNLTYTCDYRIKKNVQPLGSMWDRVKALNPIRYSQKAYDIWVDDDTERWGFMAHELQEQLDPSAASGVKDGDEVQSPNLLAIIAGLTKALQEAMLRIEALEAA